MNCARIVAAYEGLPQRPQQEALMRKSAAERAPRAISGRNRNSGRWRNLSFPSPRFSWSPIAGRRSQPRTVIQRAVAAAAEIADADVGEAELAVMLTDDAGIRTLNSNWRGIDKPTNVLSFPALPPTGADGPDDAARMLAISRLPTRRRARRRTTNKSRSTIILAISRCMGSASDRLTITKTTPTPTPWRAWNRDPGATRHSDPYAGRERMD